MSSISSVKPFDAAGFRQELKFYLPSMGLPPEIWTDILCSSAAVGDMYIVFEPEKEEMLNANLRELKTIGLVLVYSNDNAFPMSYWVDDNKYESSFMEGAISSHASKANSTNKALFCLRLSPKETISDEIAKKLSKLAKEYGGKGERHADGKSDILEAYLRAVNLEYDAEATEFPSIAEIADYFWDAAGLVKTKTEKPTKKERSKRKAESTIDLEVADTKPEEAELKGKTADHAGADSAAVESIFGDLLKDEPESKSNVESVLKEEPKAESTVENLFKEEPKTESTVDNLVKEEPKTESTVDDLFKDEPQSESTVDNLVKEEPKTESTVDDLFKDEPQSESTVDNLFKEEPKTESTVDDLFKDEPQSESTVDNLVKEEPKTESTVDDLFKEEPKTESTVDDLFKEEPKSESTVDDLFKEEPKSESTVDNLFKEEPQPENTVEDLVKEEPRTENTVEDLVKEEPRTENTVDNLVKAEPKAELEENPFQKAVNLEDSSKNPFKSTSHSAEVVDNVFNGSGAKTDAPEESGSKKEEPKQAQASDKKDLFAPMSSPFDSLSNDFAADDVFGNSDPLGDLFAEIGKAPKANPFERKAEAEAEKKSLENGDENSNVEGSRQSMQPDMDREPSDDKGAPISAANEADLLADLFSRTANTDPIQASKTDSVADSDLIANPFKTEDERERAKDRSDSSNIEPIINSTLSEASKSAQSDTNSSQELSLEHSTPVLEELKPLSEDSTPESVVETSPSDHGNPSSINTSEPEAPGVERLENEITQPEQKPETISASAVETTSLELSEKQESMGVKSESKPMPDDMTSLMKNRLNELGFNMKPADHNENMPSAARSEAEQSSAKKPGFEVTSAEAPVSRSERRQISLEATLRKLEEQKKAAFDKIEQFIAVHESACIEKISSLIPEKTTLDNNINFEILKRRESVLAKLTAEAEAARDKLRETVSSYKKQLDAQLETLASSIESAKNDAGIYREFKLMNHAADSFANNYKADLVRLLDTNLGESLGEHTKDELARISTWNKSEIEEHRKHFELKHEQIKDACSRTASMLEELASKKTEELESICDQYLEILKLQETSLTEAAAHSDQVSRQEFNRSLEKLLAERGLPFLSEQNLRSREILHSLVMEFNQELESRALDSLNEIKIILENSKKRMIGLADSIEELRSGFDTEARSQTKEQLNRLSEHLDEKFNELKDFFNTLESEAANSQKCTIKRIKHIRQIGMAIINAANEKDQLAVAKLIEKAFQQCYLSLNKETAELRSDLSSQLEGYNERRAEPRRRLKEKLEQLTQLVESIAPDYL